MKTIADATIPVHQYMVKFEIWHFYTHLFEYIRQDKNRIWLVSCSIAYVMEGGVRQHFPCDSNF
jgi:hypothetical protein